jgi:nickel/cobalt transporter (NiCoT) family protein
LTELESVQSKLGLSRVEKLRILLIYSALAVATLIGFTVSIIVGQLSVLLAGLGILCYTFGLRHAVDADHIAAIDNTTRKLLQEGKRPLTVGLWFSLGHSTIVVGLIVSIVLATKTAIGQIPALQSNGAIIGTTVSGVFLFLIGLVNALIVIGIYRIFTTLKQGKLNESELENLLENRGFLNRYFKGLFRIVKKPWQIFPIGVLFGLGFDTASEVALIAISVGVGVSSRVPLWMILVLPFMFTCGMVLIDTTDGVTMRTAYGWAFLRPVRKIYYNLTVTIISVAVAFAIGGVELLQVVSDELKLNGPFWAYLGTLDFETLGFAIIGIFVVSWLASMAYWKIKRYDDLYT